MKKIATKNLLRFLFDTFFFFSPFCLFFNSRTEGSDARPRDILNFALACAIKTFHTIRRPRIASIQQAKAQKLHRPANDEVTKNTIF